VASRICSVAHEIRGQRRRAADGAGRIEISIRALIDIRARAAVVTVVTPFLSAHSPVPGSRLRRRQDRCTPLAHRSAPASLPRVAADSLSNDSGRLLTHADCAALLAHSPTTALRWLASIPSYGGQARPAGAGDRRGRRTDGWLRSRSVFTPR
jgi:hypothetical protein